MAARIYGFAGGEIAGIRQQDDREPPPQGFTSVLEFDPETNPVVLPQLSRDHNGHRLLNGVLTLNGTPYAINPDGPAELDRKALAAIRNKLEADQAPSAAEQRVVLRHLLRQAQG